MRSKNPRDNDRGVAWCSPSRSSLSPRFLSSVLRQVCGQNDKRRRAMANNEAAGLLVQGAIDHAISILDQNIPQPVPPEPQLQIQLTGSLTLDFTTIQGQCHDDPNSAQFQPIDCIYVSTPQDAELTSRSCQVLDIQFFRPRTATSPPMKSPGSHF